MNYDLDCAKARLGITDTAQDVEIQAALDTALDLVERYLDRYVMKKTMTETFLCHSGNTISLSRYPVSSIASVAPETMRTVDMENGLIYFGCGGGCSTGNIGDVVVTYEGGYDVGDIPPALLMALCSVFDNVWGQMTSGAAAVGGISRITLQDLGTVTYESGASQSGGAAESPIGAAMYVLDLFRRHSA